MFSQERFYFGRRGWYDFFGFLTFRGTCLWKCRPSKASVSQPPGCSFPFVGSQVSTFDKWENDTSLSLLPKASGGLTFKSLPLKFRPLQEGLLRIPEVRVVGSLLLISTVLLEMFEVMG